MKSDAFFQRYHLDYSTSKLSLELDRTEQDLFLKVKNSEIKKFERGHVLQSLLETPGSLTLTDFFLYYLDFEEKGEQLLEEKLGRSICRCYYLTEAKARNFLSHVDTPFTLCEKTGAGSLCGKCMPDICGLFYQERKGVFRYKEQKQQPKKTAPKDLLLFLGEKFPQLKIESFYESCLYYQKGDGEIDEEQIKKMLWSEFKEKVFMVALS